MARRSGVAWCGLLGFSFAGSVQALHEPNRVLVVRGGGGVGDHGGCGDGGGGVGGGVRVGRFRCGGCGGGGGVGGHGGCDVGGGGTGGDAGVGRFSCGGGGGGGAGGAGGGRGAGWFLVLRVPAVPPPGLPFVPPRVVMLVLVEGVCCGVRC